MYKDLIIKATNCSINDVEEIEEYMRQIIFHSTLDWQTKSQLIQAAKLAWGDIQFMRSPEGLKYMLDIEITFN